MPLPWDPFNGACSRTCGQLQSSFYCSSSQTSSAHLSPGGCSSPSLMVAPVSDFRGLAFRTYDHRKIMLANGHGHNLRSTVLMQTFSQHLSWKVLLKRAAGFSLTNQAHILSLGKLHQTLQIPVLQCQMLIFLHSLNFQIHFITDSMEQTQVTLWNPCYLETYSAKCCSCAPAAEAWVTFPLSPGVEQFLPM